MCSVFLIPAFNPGSSLVSIVRDLVKAGKDKIIVIDDGSCEVSLPIFEKLSEYSQVVVIRHPVNLGKGAAIKTGAKYYFEHFNQYDGFVTVDADGQHNLADSLLVANELHKNPQSLILGVRQFDGKVPLSRFLANQLTRCLVRILFGLDLVDTQTGLRGYPTSTIPFLLSIPYNRYEYEMEVLIKIKRNGFPIKETTIKTIYTDDKTSHFNPFKDSIRVYSVLFRHKIPTWSTAFVDFLVFFSASIFLEQILISTYIARMVVLIYNYLVVNTLVNKSPNKFSQPPLFSILLLIISGFLSASVIEYLRSNLGISIFWGKITAELLIFLTSYMVQKETDYKKA